MKTAMILAAGRGERLKPLTRYIPKALYPINGAPVIERHVTNLAKAGFTKIIINHAYLGSQIRQHLGNGERWEINIVYSPEPPGGLETGGGIFQALSFLGEHPFVTVNVDIVTDFDFSRLTLPRNSLVHLVLVENPEHNNQGDFSFKSNSTLLTNERQYTFLGIAIYHPKAFVFSSIGRYSVTPLLRHLITHEQVTGELFDGQWRDIGIKR